MDGMIALCVYMAFCYLFVSGLLIVKTSDGEGSWHDIFLFIFAPILVPIMAGHKFYEG